MHSKDFDITKFTGRNRRLLYEWQKLEYSFENRDMEIEVLATNPVGLPTSYIVNYHIRSFCGVTNMDKLNQVGIVNEPIFADKFSMIIDLPENYPSVDGAPLFRFMTTDANGDKLAHPWHPNIRWAGDFAGRVCINMSDTYTDLVWGVERVAGYLRYESYHALPRPPYPEDQSVAAWVIRQAEPNGWIPF